MSRITAQATPQTKKETWVELLLDLFAGWLLTASMCLVVDAQFPTQAGIFTVLWHTAAVLAALTLLTRRWWILVGTLGAGVVVTFFCLLPWSELTATLTTVKEFFLWWFSNLPLDSPWYTPQTMYILHSLIHLGLSVLVFVMLRTLRRSWPLVLLGGALQVFIILVASKDNSALSLGLYVSGIFPLLARDRYMGRRMFSQKRRYHTIAPRWQISLASALLCLVVSAAMLFALPADTSNLRLRLCSDGVADLQTVTDWYLEDQKENTSLTLHDMGLQPSIFRLGGSLEELPSQVIAATNLTEETLVKVITFDTFTGKNWTNEFTTGYRANGYWDKKQADSLASQALANEAWAKKLALVGEKKPVTVTTTAPLFLLPTVGPVLSITEDSASKSTLSFNDRGELLTYTYPMPVGYTYTMETLDIPLENNLTPEAYQAVTSVAMSQKDPLLWDDAFYTRYTAIPDRVTVDSEKFLAAVDPTVGVTFKLEQVLMLSRFFSLEEGYVYDEDCGKTGYNDNVVDQVLRTKRGYCVHYATAMAMMARSIGVPSRLAAGYRTVAAPDGTQVIDTAKPYVWVECYFDNFGWLPFDPTPGEGFNKPIQDKPNLMPEEQQPTVTPEQEEPVPEQTPFLEKLQIPPKYRWIPPVALLVLALGALVLRGLLAPRFYEIGRVRKRYFYNRQQAQHYYQDILRQFTLLGYPLQTGDTLYELLDRFDNEDRPVNELRDQQVAYRTLLKTLRTEPADYRPEDTLAQRLAECTLSPQQKQLVAEVRQRLQPIVELHYAHLEPDDKQIETLYGLREELESILQQQMNPALYFLRRRVLLPRTSRVTAQYR